MHSATEIGDLPEGIISKCILGRVTDIQSRNRVALVCRKWREMERGGREELCLRGNVRNLYTIPMCFASVTRLDISCCSPWGYPLIDSSTNHGLLHATLLKHAFPAVTDLTVYARTVSNLDVLPSLWPNLRKLKLVRWHTRSTEPNQQLHPHHYDPPPGSEIAPILRGCTHLAVLDLSQFYCWTDDVPAALQAEASAALNLRSLELTMLDPQCGLKATEFCAVVAACQNLERLRLSCVFDPRYMDFVADHDLDALASNCPKLRTLHLLDSSTLETPYRDRDADAGAGADQEEEEEEEEEGGVSRQGIENMVRNLVFLEDFVLDTGPAVKVRDTGPPIAVMGSRLKSLSVGHLQSVCKSHGIAACNALESLSVSYSWDFFNSSLESIAGACTRLTSLRLHACHHITEFGLATCAFALRRTLTDVSVSFCRSLDTAATLRALRPLSDSLARLHFDCVWSDVDAEEDTKGDIEFFDFMGVNQQRRWPYADCYSTQEWKKLRTLSVWIPVGKVLTPLTSAEMGLSCCPCLEEMRIQVSGDSRYRAKPREWACGLSCLAAYPALSKLELNCSEVTGFALSAPSGKMDLSLWERWYLNGLSQLCLSELNYWPPVDKDMHRRGISLPAAGHLSECASLRKLFIHGTAHEHFMFMLLRIHNLRDVQLREDYYPAHDDDTCTEMRTDSCCRFEEALARRGYYD